MKHTPFSEQDLSIEFSGQMWYSSSHKWSLTWSYVMYESGKSLGNECLRTSRSPMSLSAIKTQILFHSALCFLNVSAIHVMLFASSVTRRHMPQFRFGRWSLCTALGIQAAQVRAACMWHWCRPTQDMPPSFAGLEKKRPLKFLSLSEYTATLAPIFMNTMSCTLYNMQRSKMNFGCMIAWCWRI